MGGNGIFNFTNFLGNFSSGEFNSFGNNLENIIDFIMRNDPNSYGTPPASEKSINKLKRYTLKDITQIK